MTTVIECNNLTKRYGKKTALNEFSLNVTENKIVGLIGRNGAGKTTFLKTCAGYLRPTAGEITIWGEKPFDNLNVLSNLIFIDEEIQYDPAFKINDILSLGKKCYPNWDETFSQKLLRYFGLNERLKYKKLSRGMKTQVNIIMGICSRAPLTLMDEPTLGLDAAVRREFANILLKDYMEHPRTIIISSHLLNEIENMLEDVILIHSGALALHKPIEELQEYAVYLNGKREIIIPFVDKKQILNIESFGNSVIAAINNELDEAEYKYLAQNNVEIKKVSVEDVCIYLTKGDRGGAFDDFE